MSLLGNVRGRDVVRFEYQGKNDLMPRTRYVVVLGVDVLPDPLVYALDLDVLKSYEVSEVLSLLGRTYDVEDNYEVLKQCDLPTNVFSAIRTFKSSKIKSVVTLN